jgi:hypothetical protein
LVEADGGDEDGTDGDALQNGCVPLMMSPLFSVRPG